MPIEFNSNLKYWWVNQNKTFEEEVGGGYMWSPQLKKNGMKNPFYEFMLQVQPGDIVFSYAVGFDAKYIPNMPPMLVPITSNFGLGRPA